MLTSLPQLKAFLNIPGSDISQDRQIKAIQSAAESIVLSRIKRNIEKNTYTEYYAGNSQRSIVLRNRPVLSIQSINEDYNAYYETRENSFLPASLLTQGYHYVLDVDTGTTESKSGLVIRIGGVWMEVGRVYFPGKLSAEIGPTYGNLKVCYTAGYEEVPQDLQYAVCLLVSFMRRNVNVGGVLASEKIGDYEYKLFDPSLNATNPMISSVDQILTRYREQSL